jgi:hypothetical protein
MLRPGQHRFTLKYERDREQELKPPMKRNF